MANSKIIEEKLKRFLFLFIDSTGKFIDKLKEKYKWYNLTRIGNCVFLCDGESEPPIVYNRICLGFFFNNKFVPSNLLLKELSNSNTNKAFVDDKGAIKFVYGKKCNFTKKKINLPQKAFLVIYNDACIGFGKINKGKIIPFYDVGFTERLEMKNQLSL